MAQAAGFAASQWAVAGLAAISTALVARNLSTVGFGSQTFATSFLLFTSLFFDFGLFLPAARLTALQGAADRPRMMGAALLVFAPVGLLYGAAIFALSFGVDEWFNVHAGHALRLVAPLTIAYPLGTLASYLAQGADRLHVYSVTSFLSQLLYVAGLVAIAVAHVKVDVVLVLELRVISMAITSIAFVLWLSPMFRGAITLVPRVIEHACQYGFQVYIGAVLGIATYNMDVLMVGALADAKSVGYYALAGSAAYVVGLPVYGMCKALFPRMTSDNHIRRRWVIFASVSGLAGAVAVTALAHLIVPLVFSSRYAPAIGLIGPLALAEAVRGVTSVYNSFLSAQGRGKELRTAALVLTGSNLILNFALIPPFGALGAAWASLAALAANLVAHVLLYRRSAGVPAAILGAGSEASGSATIATRSEPIPALSGSGSTHKGD